MRKPINIHTWELKGHPGRWANESYSLWKLLDNLCLPLFDNHCTCTTRRSESLVLLCKQKALPHITRIYLPFLLCFTARGCCFISCTGRLWHQASALNFTLQTYGISTTTNCSCVNVCTCGHTHAYSNNRLLREKHNTKHSLDYSLSW